MITPKQKAKELVFRFFYIDSDSKLLDDFTMTMFYAKRCALIAVEEILDLNLGLSNCDENNWDIEKFYIEVKQEIQKL